jgi:hypothetical protein
MKKIIRWLADVSGVTKEIETENTKFIGNEMLRNSVYYGDYPIFEFCIEAYSKKLMEGIKKINENDILECRDKTFNYYKSF